MSPRPSKRTAPCPRCGQRAALDAGNAWPPFCSERCKMIDLGKWASEQYAIPAQEQSRDVDDDAPQETPH